MIRLRSLIKSNRGQSLVELAIVLPILLVLIFGIVEFGRVLSAYLIIENLARDGARYGAVGHNDAEIQALIASKNPGLASAVLVATPSPVFSSRSRGDTLTVTVQYQVNLVSPFIDAFLPNPYPLETSCSMMVE
ncbi:MAG: TadE/TadG family type IV pilus assembly protein [Acidobacteriota bacterium]